MRLIDADALLQKAVPHGWSTPKWVSDIMIEDAPTIDAVLVVRCCDCKWFQCNIRLDGYLPNGVDEYECRHWCGGCDPTDFCSYGERKDDADNG